jgi:hypothetical protein
MKLSRINRLVFIVLALILCATKIAILNSRTFSLLLDSKVI